MKETTYEPRIINICKQVAYYSAGIGTFIFILFLISKGWPLAVFGLIYSLGAFILNTIFLIILLFHLLSNKEHWRKILATSILMLSNIPLCALYIYIQSLINY